MVELLKPRSKREIKPLNRFERAISLACVMKKTFVPFTYADVKVDTDPGLRKKFREWCEQNDVMVSRERLPGQKGTASYVFYPFVVENQRKILASPRYKFEKTPVKGVSVAKRYVEPRILDEEEEMMEMGN